LAHKVKPARINTSYYLCPPAGRSQSQWPPVPGAPPRSSSGSSRFEQHQGRSDSLRRPPLKGGRPGVHLVAASLDPLSRARVDQRTRSRGLVGGDSEVMLPTLFRSRGLFVPSQPLADHSMGNAHPAFPPSRPGRGPDRPCRVQFQYFPVVARKCPFQSRSVPVVRESSPSAAPATAE